MLRFLLFLLGVYGLTFVLVDAKIFGTSYLPIRPFLTSKSKFFRDLLQCYFCTGFHVAWIIYVLLSLAMHTFNTISLAWWLDLVMYSLSGAAFSYVTETVVANLERGIGKLD